ncbi:alkaline phosphatase family protein [Paenilisteria rocourtiae]|uniref:Putative AlkP superfamily pyrophosphatase or phosphodiesterase n=1 Tax=Listeria rocourtiae TaxID=647910 RepID=A0A4R6ZNR0_9LIST|nr:ectonucleotide pyrophosphatase/phosphodiesterase [Listeria rocourtiae]EUJ51748.1 nucleotide pyrophosphatase [Listeria rocourtiae FSL F6-920]MBC1603777.1 alkaline phosphatase family protein [Listeria rocourtiae]TDR54137.1 putative AlkP superfamily pyrophosphatase or phosphodiesterase [Listeria rocourtiae]
MSRYLVVVSLDALGAEDLENVTDLPTLAFLKDNGVHVAEVETIYPSLTYPAHTTLVTGHYPRKHGIVNNTKIQPGTASPDWFWYRDAIKVPTLYDVAKQAGLTTAAFLWPVAARSSIDYNIAEIFPNRFWLSQVMVSLWGSSPGFLMDMNRRFGKLRRGIAQPELDDFLIAAVEDTILRKKPNLLLAHFVDMDSMRHAHGVKSQEARDALKRHDTRLARIIEASKRNGTYEETVFIVLGDHYQIDVHSVIQLNVLFAEQGWLTLQQDKIIAWEVYAKSCDGSCYIYTKGTVDLAEIQSLLESQEGIEKTFDQEEAVAFGADKTCTLMIEAKAGYYFKDNTVGEVIQQVMSGDIGNIDFYRAVHGYSPQKPNYATTMIAFGKGIKNGTVIPRARLIDEAPTFAAILNLDLPNTEGAVIEAIFD